MELKQKKIAGHYAIATDSLDDSAVYSPDGDCCLYFNVDDGWGNFANASFFCNEVLLAIALEAAAKDDYTKNRGFVAFPIYVETLISTVNTDSFNECVLRRKRSRALAKLEDEDLVVLGLMGEGEQQ